MNITSGSLFAWIIRNEHSIQPHWIKFIVFITDNIMFVTYFDNTVEFVSNNENKWWISDHIKQNSESWTII